MSPRIATAACLALALLINSPLQAQTSTEGGTSLRERIKAKVQERRAAREAKTDRAAGAGLQSASLQHDGMQRDYLVYVPKSYQSGQPMPLVLAFHGGGGHAQFQADHYGIQQKAESAGFIAVFPNGYSRLPGGKFATWNAGNCCAQARDKKIDDVGFVRALVAKLQADYSIDKPRIFATGMSNGGMLSHRLACEMADVFKAVAPVAGTDNTLECKPAKPISVLHIHAKNDTHVLFNGGAGEDAFKDKSMVTDFTSVPETIQRWSTRNRCTGPVKKVLEVPGAYCEVTQGCADGVQVEMCVTESGGHSWPGAEKTRAGKEAPSQAINANDVMWDFFSRVSKR